MSKLNIDYLVINFYPGLIFSRSEYSISVEENIPVGTQLTDLGIEILGTFSFSIRFSIPATITAFSINQDTGVISVAQSLDYETQQLYTFPVTATGSFQLSAEADVRIMVLDVDDNAPIFDQAIYNTILPFDGLRQWSFKVAATDADSGENGEIIYSIIGGNDDGFFPNSGKIRVGEATTFDPEIYPSFDLTVQASNPTGSSPGDGTGQGQGLAMVRIDVEAIATPSPSTTTTAAPDETTTYFSTPESLIDFSRPSSFAEATLHIHGQRGMKPLVCTSLPALALLLSILAALGM